MKNNTQPGARTPWLLALGVAAALAGCATPTEPVATVQLVATQVGEKLDRGAGTFTNRASATNVPGGQLRFAQRGDTLTVAGDVVGLKPLAEHGFHVHEKGDCSAADGSSAGAHFNPTGQPHGAHGQGMHHVGDMPMIKTDKAGAAQIYFTSKTLTLKGPNSIIGKAVIVHADPDDPKAQPAGNSGARIACGVIKAL